MNASDVARILGISRMSVYHRIKTGSIKAEKKQNGYWEIDPKDIECYFWLNSQQAADTSLWSNQTIRYHLRKGSLKGVRIGRDWRIHIDDLNRWIKDRG